MRRSKQCKESEHFRRGVYYNVNDPRKAQFDTAMRRLYAFYFKKPL